MSQFLSKTSLLVATCIFEPIRPFVARILVRLTSTQGPQWSTKHAPLNLARIYSVRPPQGGNELRAVMWTPRTMPDATAFFVNSGDGRSHLFGKLSQAGGPEIVNIRSTLPGETPGVQEFIYRKANSRQYKATRQLQWLEEEEGYRLVQVGEPLPFELGRTRKANPIATRFDLLSFTRDFGIDLEDDGFWTSDADAIYLNETWSKAL